MVPLNLEVIEIPLSGIRSEEKEGHEMARATMVVVIVCPPLVRSAHHRTEGMNEMENGAQR
jgi:hypothetical protein